MDVRLHTHLTAGLAVLGVGTALVAATPPRAAPNPSELHQVMLTSETLPLATAFTEPSPVGLIGQQVAFHVAFVSDFLGTGAELFARELPIPLTLAGAIASGTPVPIAVNQALHDFVAVELDAGRALIGFGTEYVRFQAQFATELRPRPLSGAANAASTMRANPTTPLSLRAAGSSRRGTQAGHNTPTRPLPHRRTHRSAPTESAAQGNSATGQSAHDQHDRHARKNKVHHQDG
jgi:hypothetical protein